MTTLGLVLRHPIENRFTPHSSQGLCYYSRFVIEYDIGHSLSLIQLTHCASIQFKSEGDVVVVCLRQYGDRLHVFSFKVVSDNCIRVGVPLKPLEIQSVRCNSYEFHLGPSHTTPEKFEKAALFLWLDLPSTPIRLDNGAFRKRSSNRRNLKAPALCFGVDGKQFENRACSNR